MRGTINAMQVSITAVNWFRVDDDGKFIWPGFGENIRVLKWIIDRVNGRVGARQTPIGLVPNIKDLELEELNIAKEKLQRLFEIDLPAWQAELQDIETFFNQFGRHIPPEIWHEYKSLASLI